MKAFRTISNLILLVAAMFLGYSYINKKGIFSKVGESSGIEAREEQSAIAPSFSGLVNQNGDVVNSKDFLGKHLLVFFGFTSCKMSCPAGLGLVSQLLDKLGDSANKLQVLFVTVDPKKDTVDRLKEYHGSFDKRIQMLTGSEEDIKSIVSGYKVYVGGVRDGDQIDHSSFMYLIDKSGKYIAHFTPDFKSPLGDDQTEKLFSFVKKHLSS